MSEATGAIAGSGEIQDGEVPRSAYAATAPEPVAVTPPVTAATDSTQSSPGDAQIEDEIGVEAASHDVGMPLFSKRDALMQSVVAAVVAEVKAGLCQVVMCHEEAIGPAISAKYAAILQRQALGQLTSAEAETRLARLAARLAKLQADTDVDCDALANGLRATLRAQLGPFSPDGEPIGEPTDRTAEPEQARSDLGQ